MPALARTIGYPKGRARLQASRARLVNRLNADGRSNCDIARRLSVSEKAIRKRLRRLGWREQAPIQTDF